MRFPVQRLTLSLRTKSLAVGLAIVVYLSHNLNRSIFELQIKNLYIDLFILCVFFLDIFSAHIPRLLP